MSADKSSSEKSSAKAGERMSWDHHADHDLLTAMVQELQPTQEQLRGVMVRMHAFGYNCTVKAITYFLPLLSLHFPHSPFPFPSRSNPLRPIY